MSNMAITTPGPPRAGQIKGHEKVLKTDRMADKGAHECIEGCTTHRTLFVMLRPEVPAVVEGV